MSGDGELQGAAALKMQARKRGEHPGVFEFEDHGVEGVQEPLQSASMTQLRPGRTLDDAHQQSGADAVSRHVNDERCPAARVLDEVDQIAANVATRYGQSPKLEAVDALR